MQHQLKVSTFAVVILTFTTSVSVDTLTLASILRGNITQSADEQSRSLKGLRAVQLLIVPPRSGDLKQIGTDSATLLSGKTLEALAILELQKGGIGVLQGTHESVLDGTAPSLYLRIDIDVNGAVCAYNIILELSQRVTLTSDRAATVRAVTWAPSRIAAFGLMDSASIGTFVRASVAGKLRQFVSDHQEANRVKKF